MNKVNYSAVCESTLEELKAIPERKKLLLHVCCAPCASSVIEYLEGYVDLTLFFYNPNISDREEFYYRLSELQRFVEERGGVQYKIITPKYESDEFSILARGLEDESEGGARCKKCYRCRLEATARAALDGGFDFFATTLSVSPYKNAEALNTIGAELEKSLGVAYLPSDFKKKNGYLRSIELSSIYNLYRQDYCGCSFSAAEASRRKSHQGTDPQDK